METDDYEGGNKRDWRRGKVERRERGREIEIERGAH